MAEFDEKDAKRIMWVDAAKGIGMFFVIIGHGPVINQNLWEFIWAFHMPLFFFLSGYTFNKKENKKEFIKKKLKRLIIPYIFTVIVLLCVNILQYLISVGDTIDSKVILKIIHRWIYGGLYGSCWSYEEPFIIFDIGAIWFLVTLFCAEIIFNELLHFKDDNLVVMMLVVLLYIGMQTKQFIWLPWNVKASFVMLSVMWSGYICKKYNLVETSIGIWNIVTIPILLICIVNNSMCIVGNNSYTYGLLSLVGAVIISIYVCKVCHKLICNIKFFSSIFSYIGRYSLIVLCFHLVELNNVPWLNYINFFENSIFNNTAIIISKLMLLLIIVVLCRRINFLKRIFSIT